MKFYCWSPRNWIYEPHVLEWLKGRVGCFLVHFVHVVLGVICEFRRQHVFYTLVWQAHSEELRARGHPVEYAHRYEGHILVRTVKTIIVVA